jgi:hypothetical protein
MWTASLFVGAALLLLYFVRSARRAALFIIGGVIGHAWLLYRHLTKNSEVRKQKRSYLEQNPAWKAAKEGKSPPMSELPKTLTSMPSMPLSTGATPGSTASPPLSTPLYSRSISASTPPSASRTGSTTASSAASVITPRASPKSWALFANAKQNPANTPPPVYTFAGREIR